MHGFLGVRVDRRGDVCAACDRVLSANRPALVEARDDAKISIILPHVGFGQARSVSSAVLKGDPGFGMVLDSAKPVFAWILPDS